MLRAHFPDDPASMALDIDRCLVAGDVEGQARVVEQMIRVVGDDAHLRMLLAAAVEGGRLDAALAEATRSVELEPTLVEAPTTRAHCFALAIVNTILAASEVSTTLDQDLLQSGASMSAAGTHREYPRLTRTLPMCTLRDGIQRVVITAAATKDLRKVPAHIVDNLFAWATAVRFEGLEAVRRIPGYHDEPLRGDRKGVVPSRVETRAAVRRFQPACLIG